jgi:hypothetical protein
MFYFQQESSPDLIPSGFPWCFPSFLNPTFWQIKKSTNPDSNRALWHFSQCQGYPPLFNSAKFRARLGARSTGERPRDLYPPTPSVIHGLFTGCSQFIPICHPRGPSYYHDGVYKGFASWIHSRTITCHLYAV